MDVKRTIIKSFKESSDEQPKPSKKEYKRIYRTKSEIRENRYEREQSMKMLFDAIELAKKYGLPHTFSEIFINSKGSITNSMLSTYRTTNIMISQSTFQKIYSDIFKYIIFINKAVELLKKVEELKAERYSNK